jgi:hypothetical protein
MWQSAEIKIHQNSELVMERLEQVEIFHFHIQKLHSQLVGLVTAVMYQVTGSMRSLVYGMSLYLLFLHVWPANPQRRVCTFAIKGLDTLDSLKHVLFDTNRLYQFITPHSTLNATQLTKPPTKHVKITSFSLPIYSTLKFTYVIEYDRRPHNDTQTE